MLFWFELISTAIRFDLVAIIRAAMASRKRRRVGDDTVPSWADQARRIGGAEAEPHVPSGPRAVPNWADQNIAQIQAAEKLWNFILLLYSIIIK